MNNNLLLGAKYYRYDENDNINLIRVIKFCSDSEIKVIEDGNKEAKRITIKELEEQYIRLEPHAIVNFCLHTQYGVGSLLVRSDRTSQIYLQIKFRFRIKCM